MILCLCVWISVLVLWLCCASFGGIYYWNLILSVYDSPSGMSWCIKVYSRTSLLTLLLLSHRTKKFGRDRETPVHLCVRLSVHPTTFWSTTFEWKQIFGPYFLGSCIRCWRCVTDKPHYDMIVGLATRGQNRKHKMCYISWTDGWITLKFLSEVHLVRMHDSPGADTTLIMFSVAKFLLVFLDVAHPGACG
jgi:hypothetical protein